MNFIKHYFHEIYSVITLLFITLSAIFVIPDLTQKLTLAFALLFLLHEWEENIYPGGFFDMLFAEAMNLNPMPSGEKLIEARVYVYLLLLIFTFLPYFGHTHVWLILPIAYLGILEGIAHNAIPRIFRLHKKYLPGVVTAICQFILSMFTFYILIQGQSVTLSQYIIGFIIFVLGFFLMGKFGMATNGIDFKEVPKSAIANLKIRRGMI